MASENPVFRMEVNPRNIPRRIGELRDDTVRLTRGAFNSLLNLPKTAPRAIGQGVKGSALAIVRAPGAILGAVKDATLAVGTLPIEIASRAINGTRNRVSSLFNSSPMTAAAAA